MNKIKINFGLVILFWFILIIGSIFYLAFFINLSGNNSLNQFNMSTDRTIILRLDDVQAWAWNKITINLTETILEKNMSITLDVIPKYIETDPTIKNYIISKLNDPRVEIAQHGTNHTEDEYANLSESESYYLAKSGFDKIIKTFGIKPITFIPPHDAYNENITRALSKLGFIIFSAKQGEYKFDGNMFYLGYTVSTKDFDKEELNNVDEVVNKCKINLQLTNVCVIMIHPQDYANSDLITLNTTRYSSFIKLLDELNSLNATFSTFRDLIE